MMKSVHILIALSMIVGSAGCATSESGSALADNPNCIQFREIRAWQAIDTQHLYVESPGEGNLFLFTLISSCPGIENTQDMWLSVRSGYLCASNMGEVLFRDGMMSEACPITRIEQVANVDQARALVRSRKSEAL